MRFIKRYLFKKSRLLRALVWIADNFYHEYQDESFGELGEKCFIHPTCSISHGNKLFVKNNVQLNSHIHFFCQGGLFLGNNVTIAAHTLIITSNHDYRRNKAVPFGQDIEIRPVYIHDNVWIGANCTIMPGIEIGEGAIVGAGAVVAKDVEPCAIVAGNPARVVGHRDKEAYGKCKAEKKIIKRNFTDQMIIQNDIQEKAVLFNFLKEKFDLKKMKIEK
ncbi:MAG: acyltransferase [Bacteroidales bacterium]|nr:acyltransferase [Bacteroidales bacterium]